ncbi:SH3 domain-containing protein [Sagittula salina]|uniref:SH3 domain-containing protein n=1 Tax=Sagittula salina TaxID=2820268 RepID=A0A940MQ78_9RHOB|nr:SH3 domain-containing protein [Sagittula salina]MBP0483444.1 SH3 domain-containing protein [Sagittula salina]
MVRIFLLTFGVLGWAWYEMSGGAHFVPGNQGVQILAAAHAVESAPQTVERVARDTPAADLNAIVQPAVAQVGQTSRVRTVYVPGNSEIGVSGDKLETVVTPAAMTNAMPSDEGTEHDAAPAEIMQAAVADAAMIDYRTVTGSRVNLRGGPATSYDVVTQLLEGEEVEVLDEGDGWVKLRALDGNNVGWMSASFLTASN